MLKMLGPACDVMFPILKECCYVSFDMEIMICMIPYESLNLLSENSLYVVDT